MKEQKTTAGEGLGTAGLTIGILAIITALIPCFGWLALLLGTIALILSSVAVSQAYMFPSLENHTTISLQKYTTLMQG